MSDHDYQHDALFLAAGAFAAQAYAQSQYNNRVNAYVARGYSIDAAHAIVRAWYTAYQPPRWCTAGWCLAAAGWLLLVVLSSSSGDGSGGGVSGFFITGLGGAGLISLRIRYCLHANRASEQRARDARLWLQQRGL